MATALAGARQLTEAERVAADAERTARATGGSTSRTDALLAAANALAAAGLWVGAEQLVKDTERNALTITTTEQQDKVLKIR